MASVVTTVARALDNPKLDELMKGAAQALGSLVHSQSYIGEVY